MNRKSIIVVSLFAVLALILIFALKPSPADPPDVVEPAPQDDPADPEQLPPGDVVESPDSETPAPEILQIPPPEIFEPQAGPVYEAGSTIIHQVTQTEWLSLIARCYGAPVEAVLAGNPLYNQDIIQPGTHVTVPEVGTAGAASGPPCVSSYVVQPGDNWATIAEKVGADAQMLQRANPAPLLAEAVIVVPAPSHGQPGTTGAFPALTHDLIFTSAGSLARWNHTTGSVELYDINSGAAIMDLAANPSGSPIVAKLTGQMGLGDVPSAEIALVDLAANTIAVNPQGFGGGSVSSLFSNQLIASDNGGQAAYAYDLMEMDSEGVPDRLINLVTFQGDASGQYRAAAAPMRSDPYAVSLFPMDADNMLYADANGLWQVPYDLEGGSASFIQLLANDMSSPQYMGRGYQPAAWTSEAHDGLLVLGLGMEGARYLLFDPVNKVLYDVPNSGSFMFWTGVTLLSSSELAVINTPMEGKPILSVYSFYQDGSTEGPIQGVFEKSSMPLGAPIAGFSFDDPEQQYNILTPDVQPEAGKILLAIASNVSADNGLWSADPATGAMTRLNDFPAGGDRATWAPDGSGVLVETFTEAVGQPLVLVDYVPADGSPMVNLTFWLGSNLGDFHWVK